MQDVEVQWRAKSNGRGVRKIAAAFGIFYLSVVSPLYVLLLTMFVLPIYWTAYPLARDLLIWALIYLVGYAPPLLTLWAICLTGLLTSSESQFELQPFQFVGLLYGFIVSLLTGFYAFSTYPWTGPESMGRIFFLVAISATPGVLFGAVFVHQHYSAYH